MKEKNGKDSYRSLQWRKKKKIQTVEDNYKWLLHIKNQVFTARYMHACMLQWKFRRCQNKRKIESKWTGLFFGKWTGLNLSKISVEKFANWSLVWKKGGKKNSKEIRVELLRIWKPISKLEEKPFETMTFEFCRLNQTDFVEFSATEFHALLQPETWF